MFDLPNEQDTIYLTFDDGPHPEITPWVLDQLKSFEASATFFLIGENVQKHPELLDRIVKEGHAIGNHSYSHPSGWKTSDTTYFEDVKRGHELTQSNLFRPPYGRITRSQAQHLREMYTIIMWSDLSADFDTSYDSATCVEFATRKVKPGSIIVFHDSEKAWPRLKDALPKCLEFYRSQGFQMHQLPQ